LTAAFLEVQSNRWSVGEGPLTLTTVYHFEPIAGLRRLDQAGVNYYRGTNE